MIEADGCFEECFNNGRFLGYLKSSCQWSKMYGFSGLPPFFIIGDHVLWEVTTILNCMPSTTSSSVHETLQWWWPIFANFPWLQNVLTDFQNEKKQQLLEQSASLARYWNRIVFKLLLLLQQRSQSADANWVAVTFLIPSRTIASQDRCDLLYEISPAISLVLEALLTPI